MIGNDIVDLEVAAIESRVTRKGFLDKLFLPAEKELIQEAREPERMIWLLWSCKEAVYKIINRQTGERLYAPHHYSVALAHLDLSGAHGVVIHQQTIYPFTSCFIGPAIHTRAAIDESVLQQTKWLTGYQVTPSYTALLQQANQLSSHQVLYKNTAGIPFILNPQSGQLLPVSLSHHGNYTGVVLFPEF